MEDKVRAKQYRERIKADEARRSEYLQNDRERKKAARAKEKQALLKNKTILTNKREKDRLRQQKYRLKKKLEKLPGNSSSPSSSLGSYKCPQSLGKAVKRLQAGLPMSPTKKDVVLKKLIQSHMPELAKCLYSKKPVEETKHRKPRISDETKQLIHNFYLKNNISVQSAGKQEVKSIKNSATGKRELHQKRYMMLTVKEAYEVFKQETGISAKKSIFYQLRPKYVLPVSETPHNMCVCQYHANFNYLLEAVNGLCENFPYKGKELLPSVCCDTEKESCMLGDCETCGTPQDLYQFLSEDVHKNQEVTWKQWQRVNKKPILSKVTGSLKEIVSEIEDMLPFFKKHSYIKNVQAVEFEKKKLNVNAKECVLQVDFAENYSLVSQDEIQSAHWSYEQVTIFTACAWTHLGVESFAIISDHLCHDKHAVWTFLRQLIEILRGNLSQLKTIFVFSDGAASQFKNKYIMSSLCSSKEDFGVELHWSFFATSHGKGAVDGIGGNVKRKVWTCVKSRLYTVANAQEFFDCAREEIKGITVLFTSKDSIAQNEHFLSKRWSTIPNIPRIQSSHFFQPYDKNNLLVGKTSTSELIMCNIKRGTKPKHRLRVKDVYSSDDSDDLESLNPEEGCVEPLSTGKWVVVTYEGKTYPGEVVRVITPNTFEVSVMVETGVTGQYKWPEPMDSICYNKHEVLRIISPPVVVNSRGVFKFNDI